jgi:hypothetical protein
MSTVGKEVVKGRQTKVIGEKFGQKSSPLPSIKTPLSPAGERPFWTIFPGRITWDCR